MNRAIHQTTSIMRTLNTVVGICVITKKIYLPINRVIQKIDENCDGCCSGCDCEE
jgi:hypothetical protein